MDNMLGMDEAIVSEEKKKTVDSKLPYVTWAVDGTEYKLKLRTSDICALEKKYNKNLLLLVSDEGIPPISTMLTIIQASMNCYEHGMSFGVVSDIYDKYVDEGGDMVALMTEVLMPMLGKSGFFTKTQMEEIESEMKAELDTI